MNAYTIGIDTGGTYTDAALLNAVDRSLIAKAKALTTRGDLSVGVNEALGAVLSEAGVTGDAVTMVALSTTLATNAIVEGHGSPVGLVLCGFSDKMAERIGLAGAIPDARVLRIDGGHDHSGREALDLDEDALAVGLEAMAPHVEAIAVASRYSVRNPAHEHRIRSTIHKKTGLPVTVSSELADALDAPRRALTAALNARIIARITALIAAVKKGMAERAITAPLMIVKGDGTLATAETVADRPIETILSGPAASVIGAKFLSGLSDFVISDIGGTTTDVATLRGGWPRLNRNGSSVGGWRTMVAAIDMQTLGLGGDSRVALDGPGDVYLRSDRVVPIALIGQKWPATIARMQAMRADPNGTRFGGQFALRPLGADDTIPIDLSAQDRTVFERIRQDPVPLHEVVFGLADQRSLARLDKRGIVQIAAFTPSDAAHILGLQGQWSRPAAVLGGLLLKRSRRMLQDGHDEAEARAFAEETVEAVVRASGQVIVETLSEKTFPTDDPILEAVLSGRGVLGALDIAFKPSIPVVAVGGPAPVFYPEVGRRLGTGIVMPEAADVANAVGAAVALVKVRAIVEITSSGKGSYRIHHDGDPITIQSASEALQTARDLAREAAGRRAQDLGGASDAIDLQVDRIDIPDSVGDTGLIGATVVAECWGPPDV